MPSFSHLTDLAALVHAFKWRARTTVMRVTQDLAIKMAGSGTQAPLSFDDAWNACAVLLVDAARQHCYFVMLSRFAHAIGAVTDSGIKAVLTKLALHFALVQVRWRLLTAALRVGIK